MQLFAPSLNCLFHKLQIVQRDSARKPQQSFAGNTRLNGRPQCLHRRQNLRLQIVKSVPS